jgi:hypothetical protein
VVRIDGNVRRAMEIFSGIEDHDRYIAWINAHSRDGFVLHSNSPPDGALKLHLARCRFIGANGAPPPRGDIWTNYPKRCSTDRAELAQFADAHGGFDECQFCCR